MKKITAYFVLTAVFLITLIFPAAGEILSDVPAADRTSLLWVNDEADILTSEEENLLTGKITEFISEYDFDCVILTVNDLDNKSARDYADDYYDYNGYGAGDGRDGIMFLISTTRDYWVSGRGYAEIAFTDYGIECMNNELVNYLSADMYYSACDRFIDISRNYVKSAKEGNPFDISGSAPGENYNPGYSYDYYNDYNDYSAPATGSEKVMACAAALIVAFVISAIIMTIQKSKMKNKAIAVRAEDYLVKDSFRLSASRDTFMYSTVKKVPKPKENPNSGSHPGAGGSSVHHSSSGAGHVGGGGKF